MVTRSIVRFDFDRDVRIADAMASRLKPYVYENELYGLMPNDYPKLTLGGGEPAQRRAGNPGI